MRAPRAIRFVGGCSLLAFIFCSPALATDRYYLGPTNGPWTLPTSWNSRADGTGATGLPNEGDILFVKRDTSTTVNFNLPYTSPQYAGLYLDGQSGAEVTLQQSADSLSTDFEVVALGGKGKVLQTGGANNAGASLIVGTDAGSLGTYHLSAGSLSAVDANIGYKGTGVFDQTGGSASISGTLYIATEPGSSGTLTHSGGTLTAASIINNGQFTHSGGTVNLGNISGSGTLSIASANNLAANSLLQHIVQDDGAITIRPNGTNLATSIIDSLNIGGSTDAWAGSFDIKNNTVIIRNGSLPTVRNQIKSGLSAPRGILSTSGVSGATVGAILNRKSPGVPLYSTYAGVSGLTDTDILVRYVLKGDANFDGCVTIADFIQSASNFSTTSADWSKGDSNYDNAVTIADFIQLSSNFNQCLGPSPIAASSSIAAVPEPASITLFAASLLLIARKKRRPVLAVTPVS